MRGFLHCRNDYIVLSFINACHVVESRRFALGELMNSYFFPHLMFNFEYLIKFVCIMNDLIDSSDY